MMTPQEVSEHAFAKASFGGYNMAMVDEFLDLLTEDYTTLYKENATLKAKMKVLVEKVEEYRSTEDAMRKALLTAQRMADEMLAEAEAQKAELLAKAETEARARMGEIQKQLADEQAKLNATKSATAAYVGKARELCQQELDFLGSLVSFAAAEPPAPDPVAQAADDITASVERLVSEVQAGQDHDMEDTQDLGQQATVEVPVREKDGGLYAELLELNLNPPQGERHKRPVREPIETPPEAAPEDTSPTRRMDFSNLQFGKDYEIK